MSKGDKWTKEEELYLRKNSGKMSLAEIATMLGRPYSTVKYKAWCFGCSWTMVDAERDEAYMRKVRDELA